MVTRPLPRSPKPTIVDVCRTDVVRSPGSSTLSGDADPRRQRRVLARRPRVGEQRAAPAVGRGGQGDEPFDLGVDHRPAEDDRRPVVGLAGGGPSGDVGEAGSLRRRRVDGGRRVGRGAHGGPPRNHRGSLRRRDAIGTPRPSARQRRSTSPATARSARPRPIALNTRCPPAGTSTAPATTALSDSTVVRLVELVRQLAGDRRAVAGHQCGGGGDRGRRARRARA